jgi:hypothetical protein
VHLPLRLLSSLSLLVFGITLFIPYPVPFSNINAGDINTDARRHRWSLWYRTYVCAGDERHHRI